jgi:dTMP kinase
LAPDLTLLLSLPHEASMARMRARGAADRMEREDDAFHQRVRAAFEAALDPAWQRSHPEIGPVVSVDAEGEAEAVTGRCVAALARRWPHRFSNLVGAEARAGREVTHG